MKNKLNDLLQNGVFDSSLTTSLNKNNYANIFSVVNRGAKSYFNLCRGLHFNNVDSIDSGMYQNYTVVENDSWTSISYRFYNTIELWWLICKFNNVKNPFKELEAGTILKIPNDEIKDIVLNTINAY
jgi:hypothetical protein